MVELPDAFRVEDANGLMIAQLQFTDDPEQLAFTGRLSRDEAWRVALRVASTPDSHIAMMILEQERAAAARKRK
ncbi:hypothetical protein DK389_02470 [Methylobacterium durans]|uniref:Uncharacterized protein n=2 Tax=Methylobacterium durans TaxID=2202825 RepID=A0A2U8W273_9HYPH|nr:hypothetical protein DK389_02470 [Methylobacterium durans]